MNDISVDVYKVYSFFLMGRHSIRRHKLGAQWLDEDTGNWRFIRGWDMVEKYAI